MKKRENVKPIGICKVTHICKDKNGNIIPLSEAKLASDKVIPSDFNKNNIVVNAGRTVMANSLGGYYQTNSQTAPYINRITIGDGEKSSNLPSLADTGLASEIQKVDGTIAGTFLLEGPHEASPDITFPAENQVFPSSGSGYGSSSGNLYIDGTTGETILEDLSGTNFTTLGVQTYDQVTLLYGSTEVVLGIREVTSATELTLHNPYGLEQDPISYKIGTFGTQMLVSKLLEGNNFPVADYGEAVVVHEAGLLYNNSQLFNRVVFAPQDDEIGIIIQSDETSGTEISVRFEWLVSL